MPYPVATEHDIAFFQEHGWIIVQDAIDLADLTAVEGRCTEILENKELMAFDWALEKGTDWSERPFKILQSSPSLFWREEFADAPWRRWAVAYGSALLGRPVEFWYDQFLAKPGGGQSAETRWHQDEGYWGRALDDAGITCWMPFHDVDADNGCMHFVDGGHKDGVLEHRQPPEIASDLLSCEPDESRTVVAAIPLGAVTFHHGKTPHMTTANTSPHWRRALTQHLKSVDVAGEGEHYPWRVFVNQLTGERSTPEPG